MREILFRAKTTENEWVQGDLIHEPLLEDAPCRISYQYQSGLFVVTHTEEVLPETVGQYTGVKDKNGKKIFEGDIVEVFHEEFETFSEGSEDDNTLRFFEELTRELHVKGKVFFNHGSFDIEDNAGNFELWGFGEDEIQIIGNVYDNPEILKE